VIILRYPWALLLLGLIPLIWWAWLAGARRPAIRFSGLAGIRAAGGGGSARFRHVLPVLRSLAVALVVLSLARPQRADEQTRVQTEGVALQLVLDRSSSMGQQDFVDENGRPQSRLAVVKDVAERFVLGDGDKLRGREGDLVGLIAFAHFADTECPLTRDHRHLVDSLDRVQLPTSRDEDGTAIGDALLLATERVRNIERRFHQTAEFRIKSRAIILLTDGEQTRGKYKPEKAAEAAAALGVKVYTIGAAPEFQEQRVGGFFRDPQVVRVPVNVDEETLQQVAEMTGGKYFRARDTGSLEAIYQEIDRLERSTIDEERYYLYEELACKWATLGPLTLPPPLLAALFLIGLEVLLANTRLRRIP
jgi:Ca-activated chloride channel family protein